jgi:proline iminopeptidase
MHVTDSCVAVPGGKVFTRLIDTESRILGFRLKKISEALLFIHGGPGYPHDYLSCLSSVSEIMPVLFYDQLGCGRSDKIQDISLWKINRFVEEIEALRCHFGLAKLVLHGHSWGTIVALEYALQYPERISALIFESPCISIPLWKKDSLTLLEQLSATSQEVINETKRNFRFNNPDFIKAVDEYYQKFVHHERPKPEILQYCDTHANSEVYTTMWGPCEFIVTGTLSNYNNIDGLSKITAPILFTAGEFDEVLPETLKLYSQNAPNSKHHIIKNGRHLSHMDSTIEYENIVRNFIQSK